MCKVRFFVCKKLQVQESLQARNLQFATAKLPSFRAVAKNSGKSLQFATAKLQAQAARLERRKLQKLQVCMKLQQLQDQLASEATQAAIQFEAAINLHACISSKHLTFC